MNMRQRLERHLNPQQLGYIEHIRTAAEQLQQPVYLVGGPVRDIWLAEPSLDLDFVTEGSGILLGRKVQRQAGGELHTHERFGTAQWMPADPLPGMPAIDFVTARMERYPYPAALPEITPADMQADLFRRDYSINAMALRLDGADWGEVLDPLHGLQDLEAGVLRVMHPDSFRDDPTRIWRGIRFEQRFGLQFEPQTFAWLQAGIPLLGGVSGARLWHELWLLLEEEIRGPVLARLTELGVMAQITPGLEWSEATAVAFERLARLLERPPWREADLIDSFLGVWLAGQRKEVRGQAIRRLRLSRHKQELVQLLAQLQVEIAAADWQVDTPASAVDRMLQPAARLPEVLVGLVALWGEGTAVAELVTRYQTSWKGVRPVLNGADLIELGMQPGPQLGGMLRRLRAARLDGEVNGREDELAWVQKRIENE